MIAPTGTIGFMMDCDTTGIEPDLALVKYKKLVGGGVIKIVNNTVPQALIKLGYSPEQVEAIVSHIDSTGTIEGAPALKPEHLPSSIAASVRRTARAPSITWATEDDGAPCSRSSPARFRRPSTCPKSAPSRTSWTPTSKAGVWA